MHQYSRDWSAGGKAAKLPSRRRATGATQREKEKELERVLTLLTAELLSERLETDARSRAQ